MNNKKLIIDETLVRHLIASQFPQWKDLPVYPVTHGGWDNRTFHLGEDMLVRIPSAEIYAAQVEKEHQWLARLAPLLPLQIPVPLVMGEPENNYPWKWSIYRYLPGESAATAYIHDLCNLAKSLAEFLTGFEALDITGGPLAGSHSFYRGGALKVYDTQMREAIDILKDKIDVIIITEIWEAALATAWQGSPVWVHGDISAGNLLIKEGKLSAVIDFGQLAIGDPACDLMITWTLFEGESRKIFRNMLNLDADTWVRGCAWTLWKSLIVAADLTEVNNFEAKKCWHIIEEVVLDYKKQKVDVLTKINNFC